MATNSKQVKPLDIPFKEFTPGQVIQSVQFNDDMLDIEDKVNELVNEHNIVSDEIDSHTSNLDNPHQVDAHQTGTYNATEIDEFIQDVKSGNLNDDAITNRVLDDDCITGRNIVDNTITVSKVDPNFGNQLDISQNIEIATRYTKEETDNLIQDKVGNGTYSKEELDVKFEEVQAGVIVDSTIGIEKLKEDVGTKLNIGSNVNILNKYTKDEVDYLIRCNALPRDWGSILGDDEVEPFFDTKNGIFPVADFMIADKFVTSNDNILDFEIREVVDSRGEYETLNDRLNVYDTIKPEIIEELEVISNKINDNQNINNEEHNTINSKVLDNKNSISSLNTKVSNLENTTSTQGNKISSLERRSDTFESRASALESADRGINVKISNVENRLGSIDSLNNTQTSKINALENRANTTDNNISNINSNINSVKTDLNNVKSDLNTVKTDLNNVGQIVNENIEPIRNQLSQAVSKNNEQDNRLSSIEDDLNGLPDVISNHNDILEKHKSEINDIKYVNKRQDVMLGGLFNENADGRLNIDGTGNDVKLEGSKDGLVEINKVVGSTMVNVCDQKDPVAITKSYTAESGNHVALQGEYDGKCRPVVYGNTLVNIINPNKVYLNNSEFITKENNKFTIDLTDGAGSWVATIFYSTLFKPSTFYTLIINVIENTLSKEFVLIDSSQDNRIPTVSKYLGLNQTGLMKIKFESKPSISPSNDVVMQTQNDVTGKICYEVIGVLEGDYTNKPIPDYFTGMQSSFEDKVVTQEMVDSGKELAENLGKYRVDYKVTGKNKFDGELELGNISETGSLVDNVNRIRSINFNPIKPNTNYHISNINNAVYIAFYDSNKNFIHRSYYNSSIRDFTAPYNAKYFKICIVDTTDINKPIQLEEGSTATSYEPYKESIKTYYLNSPLLEGDTIEDNGNDVVRVHRREKRTLTHDNTSWYREEFDLYNNHYARLVSYDISTSNENTVICDTIASYAGDIEGLTYFRMTNTSTFIYFANTDTTEEQMLEFLKNNPLTVVYELASPTREVISTNDSILQDSYVGGHLDVDTAVPIDRVVFKYPYFKLKYLYPSTNYTIQFESDNIGVLDKIAIGSKVIGENIPVTKGINKINGTTEGQGYNTLDMYGIGFNMSKIVVTEATDKDFGYFSGMKSVFEDKVTEGGKYAVEVKVIGKNKIDSSLPYNYEKGYNLDNLVEGVTYTVSCEGTNRPFKISTYANASSSSGEVLGEVIGTQFTFTYNKKYDYKLFVWADSSWNSCEGEVLKVQVEEGTVATDYEPYKEYVQTLYLDEPLYKDNELCVHDGKLGYWKNWDKIVLDGSDDEKWYNGELLGDDIKPKTLRFRITLKTKAVKDKSICDKAIYKSNTGEDIVCHAIKDYDNLSLLYIRFNKAVLNTYDITGVKQYLSENPITVVYQLAEPVFVPILENTPQWVLESFNDCSIYFNSNLPITSSNLSYTGNVPSVYSMQRTNQIQDDLIDVSLMATDEMFMMLEPLLNAIAETINMKGNSKMVDMYVAMVMRGLKTIEEIPARYREEVKKVLDKLEK